MNVIDRLRERKPVTVLSETTDSRAGEPDSIVLSLDEWNALLDIAETSWGLLSRLEDGVDDWYLDQYLAVCEAFGKLDVMPLPEWSLKEAMSIFDYWSEDQKAEFLRALKEQGIPTADE
jgi:hypothetical protein